MLKMVDGTGIIGVDMICPLGVSTPQPPNYDRVELEGTGMLVLPNSLDAPLERLELIGNSVQGENPALDNPQEIKNAGRKSKNLFDAKKAKSGWITTDGEQTLATLGSRDNVASDYIQVNPGMKYTSSAGVFQNFYDSEKNFLKHYPNISSSIIIPDNAKYMIVIVPVNKALAIQTANTLMINIGSSVLPYEQYTDKKLFDLKVTGKNLFDMADIQSGNGKIESSYTTAKSVKSFRVIKDRKYLLISKGTMIADTVYSSIHFGKDDLEYMKNHADILSVGLGYKIFIGEETRTILTAKETCTITKVLIHGTKNAADAYEAEELGLFEIGDDNANINYEPYTEQSVQIALNEPLRGANKYKDVLTKDGVVRKIKSRTFDGSENWRKRTNNTVNTNHFVLDLEDVDKKLSTGGYFCDKLSMINVNADEMGHRFYAGSLYVMMPKEQCPDLEAFKTWLSQNLITAEYILAEPVTEPLSESVQAQFAALHTENGTTHVFVDSGEVEAGIKLTYRKEK